jgi:tetratricopeptide (TPR) repeat protein
LLRESKATTAALGRLEKAIKGIYQKDFKKARAELKSLIEDHTGETEILARARSYLQICIREEAAHKKPAATNDQLYGLGVMEHNIGNYEGALANFRQSLDQRPGADYTHYSIASSLAMKGDALDAIRALRRAIELNEDNRIYAKNDSDFLSLHVHKEFADLVGLTPASVGDSPE